MKRIIALIGLAAITAGSLFGTQTGESWSRLYRRLDDIKQKYAVLQNITPLDDRDLEPFFTASLDDLVNGDLSQYRTRRETYDDWEILTRTIVRELGEIKGQSASALVWKVVETAEAPMLKAEALIAIGQMRAVEYAPEISTILRNLNFNVRRDKEDAEIEAYGAVVALDKMREGVGFEPLFYASIGWYSDRVTSLAAESVLTVADDPADRLIGIMENASDYGHKRKALSLAMSTDDSDDAKVRAAIVGLREGLKYAENDFTRRRQLANLRQDAISDLIALAASDPEAPGLLNEAIDEGEMDEKLIAIQALGVDGSDEAADVLAERLAFYNERQASGLAISRDELTIVRQIIFALGETRNEAGLQALSEMEYVGYTPALIRQSREAIAKINGE